MPHNKAIDITQTIITGVGGLLAIQLPNWIDEVSIMLGGLEGFYKFIVFVLTSLLLIFQLIKFFRKKK